MLKSVLNSKIKLLKKSAGTQNCYAQRNTPGNAISQNSAKIVVHVPLQVNTLTQKYNLRNKSNTQTIVDDNTIVLHKIEL